MTQLDDAVARYHKLIESEPYRDLAWAQELQERMRARKLFTAGRPVSPVLRPHFLSRRQYTALVRAAESLFGALERVENLALSNPSLLSRIDLLPAERMLATVDPGYKVAAVTALLDTQVHNGTLQFVGYSADAPLGVAYGDMLADLFLDVPLVRDLQKRYALHKAGGAGALLDALRTAWREFGGKRTPNVAIVEFRQPFQTAESSESQLLAELFQRDGIVAEVATPDQLEYRNGQLRHGNFVIDLVYRRISVSEFMLRFDLNHPLLRAYRDRAVCVVNNFRAEMGQKKALFDLLTDERVTGGFPLNEKKAIRDFIPWTRVVATTKTTYHDELVDLPEFIRSNRERLVLKPNDPTGEQPSFTGRNSTDAAWDRALRLALRGSYVVQEAVEQTDWLFPLYRYGQLEMVSMQVDVTPHSYLGKVEGVTSHVTALGASGFSTISGLAPTFILDTK